MCRGRRWVWAETASTGVLRSAADPELPERHLLSQPLVLLCCEGGKAQEFVVPFIGGQCLFQQSLHECAPILCWHMAFQSAPQVFGHANQKPLHDHIFCLARSC